MTLWTEGDRRGGGGGNAVSKCERVQDNHVHFGSIIIIITTPVSSEFIVAKATSLSRCRAGHHQTKPAVWYILCYQLCLCFARPSFYMCQNSCEALH
jgi:hypothetical protein